MNDKSLGNVSRVSHLVNLKLKPFLTLLFFFFCGVAPVPILALSPIVQFQDLVAGDGEAGFEDGPFYQSQFNQPEGLAIKSDGSILYVADRFNHRIRAILLDEKNKVETIAGSGKQGQADGTLLNASFDQPTAIVSLPDNQMAIYDEGSHQIRLLDLNKNLTATLWKGEGELTNGNTVSDKPGLIWDLAYLKSNHCLYFTQPESGALWKLDLKTRKAEIILKNYSLIPHPAALCASDETLYLSDRDRPGVYEFCPKTSSSPLTREIDQQQPTPNKTILDGNKSESTINDTHLIIRKIGESHKVLSLSLSGDALYSLQLDSSAPVFRVFPDSGPLTFISPWPEGDNTIKNPGSLLPHFRGSNDKLRACLLADPRSEKRFFISNPTYSFISSFRDLRFTGHVPKKNSAGLVDFEYPASKPFGTYRILLVGRSHLLTTFPRSSEKKCFPCGENEMALMAKRIELTLNTIGALDDSNFHYEVLNEARVEKQTVYLWPYYIVPEIVKRYDIDQVVILMDPMTDLYPYFLSPLNPEGIPQLEQDMEFWLLPNSQKFKTGLLHDFFELCKSKNILKVSADRRWIMPQFNELTADPEVRDRLIEIIGKPLELFKNELTDMSEKRGKKIQFLFCFFPTGDVFDKIRYPSRGQRLFWKDLCRKKAIPFLDLCDDFTALRLSYFPFSEGREMDHYDINGHDIFSTIFTHELIRQQLVPFGK
jgi:hypothetical protein